MEKDVIAHLLEIEQQAEMLLKNAQLEADKRIAEVKLRADETYKEEYKKIVSGLEQEYEVKKTSLEKQHRESFDAYKAELEAIPLNKDSFKSFLDKKLFAALD